MCFVRLSSAGRSNEIGHHIAVKTETLLAWLHDVQTSAPMPAIGFGSNHYWRLAIYSSLSCINSEWCLLNVWNCRHNRETPNANHLSSTHIEPSNRMAAAAVVIFALHAMLLACACICILSGDNMCSLRFASFPFVCFVLISWWRVLLCSERNVFIYVHRQKTMKHQNEKTHDDESAIERGARCAF